MASPPCQPFTTCGLRDGSSDPRAACFDQTIDVILRLAWEGTLLCVFIENAASLGHKWRGNKSFLETKMIELETLIPFFAFDTV